jgi:DNA-binding beta-propeller fold protein YncE
VSHARALSAVLAVTALAMFRPGVAQVAPPDPAKFQDFRVTRRVVLGGDGGWDYLVADPEGGRLFITRASHVMVVDPLTGRIVGDIPNTIGVHGVALVPAWGRAFTSNGRDSSITMFELTSLATVRRIPIPARNPDAILYDSTSDRIFTFNGGSANATAIDPGTGDVLGAVALDGKPEAAVADGQGEIYVNIEDRSELSVFSAHSLVVASTWSLAPCEEPTGLALDRAARRLFVGCSNRLLTVIDANSGLVVKTLPIGGGVDGVAFDPSTSLIYASAGEGLLTVVHEESADEFEVVANVVTERGARTLALDPTRQEVYLVTAQLGPPPPATPEVPHPRPTVVPGTFILLVVSR